MVDKALTSAITEKQDTAVETTWAAGKKDDTIRLEHMCQLAKYIPLPLLRAKYHSHIQSL